MPEREAAKDPSTVSAAYESMLPTWNKVDALLGGTASMRAAGPAYAPQHLHERDEVYAERINSTVLFNMTELTLNTWVGKPFSELVTPNKEMPEQVSDLLEDIDLQGNNVTVFGRNWFRQGLSHAFSHVLVDNPMVRLENDDGQVRSRAQDLQENLRPYFLQVNPKNLIFASSEVIAGQEVLTHVRMRVREPERVGFTEIFRDKIRVYDNPLQGEVFFSEFEFNEDLNEWIPLVEGLPLGIDVIPLVTFYSDRISLMIGKSPLDDLSDLNVRHWQSYSDQINVLTVARFPLLALSGGSQDEVITAIGPREMLFAPDPNARFYYVEHQGAAIAAGRQELEDLERQMASYGTDFVRKRERNETATARRIDNEEATSPLQDSVMRFNDSLNQAVELLGKWMNIDEPGSLKVNDDFDTNAIATELTDSIKQMRSDGDISRRTRWQDAMEKGILPETFDPEEEEAQLKQEREDAFEGQAMFVKNMDPTQDDDTSDDDEE